MNTLTDALTTYLLEAVDEGCDREFRRNDTRFRLLVGGHSVATSEDPFWTSLGANDYHRLSTAAGFIIASQSQDAPEIEIYGSHHDLQTRWQYLCETG